MSLADETTQVQHDWSWAFGPSIGPSDEFREVPSHPGIRISRDGRACRDLPISFMGKYLRVYVGNRTARLVHQLVLETYRGPRPYGHEACHNDGNRTNNSIHNLRWDTSAANAIDRYEHGNTAMGSRVKKSSLIEDDIIKICEAYRSGQSTRQLGKAYGIAPDNIRQILKGKSWKHVKRDPVPLRDQHERYHAKPANELPDLPRGKENDRGA